MMNRERTIRNSLYGSSRGCHLRVNRSIQFLQRLRAKVARPAFNALLRLDAPHLKLLTMAKVSLRNFHCDRLATTIYTLQVFMTGVSAFRIHHSSSCTRSLSSTEKSSSVVVSPWTAPLDAISRSRRRMI